ncbi:MAG TPA: biotin/lipoyl-containing protein [Spirochaetota bacterium]|nr:biotin/lipoyl-containing protein [Spirochaetota bacterium]
MDIKKLDNIIKAVANKNINEVHIKGRGVDLQLTSKQRFTGAKGKKSKHTAEPFDFSTENLPAKGFAGSFQSTDNKNDICSDSIGFFSRINKKNQQKYIKLRDVIKKGDIIGLVTSMHIEHEILADKEGKVTEILVEEGQPVEYGQPLYRLEQKNTP